MRGNQGLHAASPSELTAAQIDADPLALLPGSATVIATVDARAFYASGSLGAELAALSEQLVPIGDEAGFKASRDVDRVVVGTYSSEGLDLAAVVSGRFDEAKIRQAAEAHTQTRAGGLIAASQYAGHSVYTVNDVGFAILTPKTALAGTQTGIRRALDRVHDGKVKREVAPWAQSTIDTPNAAATVTADFAQPIATAAVGAFPLPWAKGLNRIRMVADFKPPGTHVAGTITYADAPSAGGRRGRYPPGGDDGEPRRAHRADAALPGPRREYGQYERAVLVLGRRPVAPESPRLAAEVRALSYTVVMAKRGGSAALALPGDGERVAHLERSAGAFEVAIDDESRTLVLPRALRRGGRSRASDAPVREARRDLRDARR